MSNLLKHVTIVSIAPARIEQHGGRTVGLGERAGERCSREVQGVGRLDEAPASLRTPHAVGMFAGARAIRTERAPVNGGLQ